jgi:hypothetical protein
MPQLDDMIVQAYRQEVIRQYPDEVVRWPVLTGYDIKIGAFKNWLLVLLRHTGNPVMKNSSGMGELSADLIGSADINPNNLEEVRTRLLRLWRASPDDVLFFVKPGGILAREELQQALARHAMALGLAKMKIFLSHKSPDKALVREFKETLSLLGFDPWLDEEAMTAGTQLDRAILKGMEDSCAAVFFLTSHFADEAYLASEINYAIDQQRSRPNQFTIIALVFDGPDGKPTVPGLLRPFVWKEPASKLQALREILRALPVRVGPVQWR